MKYLDGILKYLKNSIRKPNPLLLVNVSFVGIFFYFLFIIDPPLYLIKNYREFFTDIYFFERYFDFPGNPIEYLSRLIIQFYNFPLLASILITALLYAIYALGFFLLGKMKYKLFVSFLPVIVLVAMHSDYNHNIKFDLQIFFTLLVSFFYFRFFRGNGKIRLLLFPVFLCFLFFFFGIIPSCLFSLFATTSELFSRGKRYYCVIILLEVLAVAILFNAAFFLSLQDVLKAVTQTQNVYVISLLPLMLYLSVLLVFAFRNFTELKRFEIGNPPVNDNSRNSAVKLKFLLSLLAIPVLTASVCYFSFDPQQKVKLSVQYFGRNMQWKKVLELSRQSDSFDRAEILYTNLALYHTGRIYDDLFKYNQEMASNGLLSTRLTSFDELVPNQQIYLELGALSLSIVAGTEATNVYGANPTVLKNLTLAYLSAGCNREGQKMLNLLDHTLFNNKWIKHYQKFVNDTSLINADPELSHYKKIQAPVAIVSKTTIDENLYLMTGSGNSNKMAYDYLMISSMLDNNMKDFAIGLSGLKYFGYTQIPKLYFEGFIAYSLTSDESPFNIEEHTYDMGTIDKFKAFQNDYLRLEGNPEEAKKFLFARYGETYWYYLKFPRPVAQNFTLNENLKERE
ncbi:MAG TPA: DUF6057 family protein [Prolixibacteraceae bacterium]|nr:DUF6057 family protein [Prolixibacteraceae bacterium]